MQGPDGWSWLDAVVQWGVTVGVVLQAVGLTIAQPWMEARGLAFLPLMAVSAFTALPTLYYWVRCAIRLHPAQPTICY